VRSATALGVATACLVVLAAACLLAPRDAGRAARSTEFQRVVVGLGAGPAIHLDVCAPDFDPRVDAACAGATEPIPGVRAFCAHHGGSALFVDR